MLTSVWNHTPFPFFLFKITLPVRGLHVPLIVVKFRFVALLIMFVFQWASSYGLVSGHWVGSWFADVFNMVLIVYCLLVLDNLVGSWNYLYRSPPWWQFLEDYKCWVDQRNKINLDCFKSIHQLWEIQKYYVVVGAISIYINLWDKTLYRLVFWANYIDTP